MKKPKVIVRAIVHAKDPRKAMAVSKAIAKAVVKSGKK